MVSDIMQQRWQGGAKEHDLTDSNENIISSSLLTTHSFTNLQQSSEQTFFFMWESNISDDFLTKIRLIFFFTFSLNFFSDSVYLKLQSLQKAEDEEMYSSSSGMCCWSASPRRLCGGGGGVDSQMTSVSSPGCRHHSVQSSPLL